MKRKTFTLYLLAALLAWTAVAPVEARRDDRKDDRRDDRREARRDDRAAPRDQESILGFTTDDLDALVARISANGGKLVGQIESMPQHGIRVVFATDPEGHLSENVQMVPS